MDSINFEIAFAQLTGNQPFPWQRDLYENWFSQGKFPDACTLPTGLGKTSVVAIWLIAQANAPDRVPRRLVYVVNRRTVVDQTTTEAENLRRKAAAASILTPAISTLRGQFADNRQWSADPSKPAIVVGTVDMIGSRLLFSGYGIGFKSRPLHAGFLGQDVLLVHDEAHLEPAFQELLLAIQRGQHEGERAGQVPWPKLRVMELTATSRGSGVVFRLSDRDRAEPEIQKRIEAKKAIHLHGNKDEKKLAEEIADLALKHQGSDRAILVFVHKVDDVDKVVKKLPKDSFEKLTGTLRGKERDELVKKPRFQRFLPESNRDKDVAAPEGTVYLVCTSAGEVGVNISADHLVCDLSTFDSMAQRFGRVNRFGDREDTRIDVVYPKSLDEEDDAEGRLTKTLELLRLSNGDGSPAALSELHEKAMREGSGTEPMSADRTTALREYVLATYAAQPKTLPVSDMLFDAWALTTIRGPLPGRPPVAAYLHGVEEDNLTDTYVAWRKEVELFPPDFEGEEILDFCPIRAHEMIRDRTYRVTEELVAVAERARKGTDREKQLSVWVVEPDGEVKVLPLRKLAEKDKQKKPVVRLAERIVLLPPSAGGLADGMLQGDEPFDEKQRDDYDVAGFPSQDPEPQVVRLEATLGDDGWTYKPVAKTKGLPEDFKAVIDESNRIRHLRRLSEALQDAGLLPMRVVYQTDLARPEEEGDEPRRYFVLKPEHPRKTESKNEAAWPILDDHRQGVKKEAEAICSRLNLPMDITRAVVLAAWWHDLGKGRRVWQLGAGNRPGVKPVSKPIHGRPPENLNHFRHELGSVIDVYGDPRFAAEFSTQEEWAQDLTLHLIAAHHGRARPHFPENEASDPERPAVASATVAAETPGRFARFQRTFGRWGLAYLESLLRAADALDSRRIENTPIGEEEAGEWPRIGAAFAWPARRVTPEATIKVAVDPTNPGQFFACCGLLELADRLWPGAEGWFREGEFRVACNGTLNTLLSILVMDPPEEVLRLDNGLEVKPLLAPLRFSFDGGATTGLVLDTWMTIRMEKGQTAVVANPPWNFWSGQQTPLRIWNPVRAALARLLTTLDSQRAHRLFEQREFLTGRFGFDPGPAWNALDVGFSPNEQGISVESSPAVELIAAVGVQRFRPRMGDSRDWFDYSTWGIPLPPPVAAAAAAGMISCGRAVCYRGRVVSRGQYAALGYSTILSGGSNE